METTILVTAYFYSYTKRVRITNTAMGCHGCDSRTQNGDFYAMKTLVSQWPCAEPFHRCSGEPIDPVVCSSAYRLALARTVLHLALDLDLHRRHSLQHLGQYGVYRVSLRLPSASNEKKCSSFIGATALTSADPGLQETCRSRRACFCTTLIDDDQRQVLT